jgi:hypothetical protein
MRAIQKTGKMYSSAFGVLNSQTIGLVIGIGAAGVRGLWTSSGALKHVLYRALFKALYDVVYKVVLYGASSTLNSL